MMNSTRESLLGLALVVAVHGGALGAMLWAPTPKSKELVLPTIQGVVIPAPPAETVQVPSAKEPPPPVERPPEPEKPKPKPKPKKVPPKPKPKPQPPPVEAPPSENAITQKEEVVEEQAAPAPQPQVSTPAVKDNDTLGAPIIPPRQDANPLNNPAPAYPTASRRMREQGTVLLQVLILPDGSVGEVRVKESSGYKRLDDTAIKAVKQWKYIPARQGDETIAYWYLQPLEFSLH
ncbi:MAG: energy transducer TonB [Porticoccaceae bacterium]